jgi:hypothetical protein
MQMDSCWGLSKDQLRHGIEQVTGRGAAEDTAMDGASCLVTTAVADKLQAWHHRCTGPQRLQQVQRLLDARHRSFACHRSALDVRGDKLEKTLKEMLADEMRLDMVYALVLLFVE